jgi:hypothetical protein
MVFRLIFTCYQDTTNSSQQPCPVWETGNNIFASPPEYLGQAVINWIAKHWGTQHWTYVNILGVVVTPMTIEDTGNILIVGNFMTVRFNVRFPAYAEYSMIVPSVNEQQLTELKADIGDKCSQCRNAYSRTVSSNVMTGSYRELTSKGKINFDFDNVYASPPPRPPLSPPKESQTLIYVGVGVAIAGAIIIFGITAFVIMRRSSADDDAGEEQRANVGASMAGGWLPAMRAPRHRGPRRTGAPLSVSAV